MSTQPAAGVVTTFTPEQLEYLAALPPAALAALIGQTKPAQPLALPKVDEDVQGRGVYLGEWEAAPGHMVHAYAADDFLRDKNKNQLLPTFNEVAMDFAARNSGRWYGDGGEVALRGAIRQGLYRDGDLVLPPRELLHGLDVYGNTIRSGANILALLEAGKLPKVAATVQNGEGDQRWALSGSGRPDVASDVFHVRLDGKGYHGWLYKGRDRAGVIPVRLYRQQAAAAPAPQVGG